MDFFSTLNKMTVRLQVPSGSLLFRAGEVASVVYLLRSGRISFVWSTPEGTHPMDIVEPGTVIGLPAAFNGYYSVTARALEDSELGSIEADHFLRLLESNPRMSILAMRYMGAEIARMRSLALDGADKSLRDVPDRSGASPDR